MRRIACLVIPALLAACTRAPAIAPADRVLLGGDVRTMEPAQPRAAAVAMRAGKLVYVGDVAGAQAFIGPDTEVLRLHGETVLPGLIDTHLHSLEGALSASGCNLHGQLLSLAMAAPLIRDCARTLPASAWLLVNEFNGANLVADRHALDRIVPDRPLLLWGADGHTAWANSAALHAAGVTRETPDPADGRIDRDAHGAPSGFLVDAAVGLVLDRIPAASARQRQHALRATLPLLHAAGITSYLEANTNADAVATFVALAQRQQLSARVTLALGSEGVASDAEFARLDALRHQAEAAGLRADVIKLFVDGVVEYPTQSAALLAPYLDRRGQATTNRGRLYIEADALRTFVLRAAKEDYGVHIHAIGDHAVRTGLDAFAAARAAGSRQRYSLAHVQFVAPADLARFGQLDVLASLQLFWASPDNYSIEASLPYLGRDRHAGMYPARSLAAHGASIAGGSDWNVSTFDPFAAMAVAVARINPEQPERGVLGAHERVSLPLMLQAYTRNAARLLGREAEIGSLRAGKAADLIVLDRTLADTSPAAHIAATKVTLTVIGGRTVFRR